MTVGVRFSTMFGQGRRVNCGFAWFAKDDFILGKILQRVHASDVLRVRERHKAVRSGAYQSRLKVSGYRKTRSALARVAVERFYHRA
jgi:hypothetical protein